MIKGSRTPEAVAQYELLWRGAGGREWHSLGVFGGNSDFDTEVYHSLEPPGFPDVEGIRAQHLR